MMGEIRKGGQYRSKGCAACAAAQGAEGRGHQNSTLKQINRPTIS